MKQLTSILKRIAKKPVTGVLTCALFAAPLSATQIQPKPVGQSITGAEGSQSMSELPNQMTEQKLRANVQLALMGVLRKSDPNAGFIAVGPLFERVSRLVRSWMNWLLGKAENPILMLEQAIRDMNIQRDNMRMAVVRAIAALKKTERNYQKNLEEAQTWEIRAKKAVELGKDDLAKGALMKKRPYQKIADSLEGAIEKQTAQVNKLKAQLIDFEERVNLAEAQKEILKSRAETAESMAEINRAMDELNVDGAAWAFEEAENQVIDMENEVEAWEELDNQTIEEQFEELESDDSIEDELARLKGES